MTKRSNRSNRLFVLLTILLMLGVTAVIGEIYLRVFAADKVWTPEQLKQDSWQLDPAVFAQHVFPLREQLFIDKQWAKPGEGYLKRYVNKLGYRGAEFSPVKPQGVTRILIYGGSFVFDIYASLNQDWPNQIQMLLHERGYTNVEVINAGIPGHRSSDSVGRLFTEGHRFDPDFVVLCNTFNDIKFFDLKKPFLREVVPYQPENNPMTNYHGEIDRLLSESSRLYTFIRQEYYQRKYKVGLEGARRRGHNHNYYEARQMFPAAVGQFELNVELFVDAAKNIGAVPVVMSQPRLVTADNAELEEHKLRNFRPMFRHQDYVVDCFKAADQIIQRVAREKSAVFIHAAAQFTGDGDMFVDHIHLSESGSRRLAAYVADQLIPLLPKP